MANKIVIGAEDGINIKDKSNMNPEPPREKVELLHEKLFSQYGIDPTELYKDGRKLKNIPKDWIRDIIIENAKSTGFEIMNQTFDPETRMVSFGIGRLCEEFYTQFNVNLFESVNKSLEAKGENPYDYMRVIVMNITVDEGYVNIRY